MGKTDVKLISPNQRTKLVTVRVHYCICMNNYVILTLTTSQINLDYYGTDWEGPVPLQDDEATVSVEELPELLSEVQQSTLRDLIPYQDQLSDDWMIHSFSVAKLFVHELCEQSS